MVKYFTEHLHLISADAEKTAQFYVKNMGAKIVANRPRPDGGASIELNLGNTFRFLITGRPSAAGKPAPQPQAPGNEHFGIGVDNLEQAVADLKKAGVKFRDEIRESRPGVKIAFMWAPDNVLIELLEKK